MQDTALVALFTGASTAIAAALGGGWAVLGESRRARHERRRLADERAAKKAAARERRLRHRLDSVRAAVLMLAVTVRVSADIRGDMHARLTPQDLGEALSRARDCYYQANVEIEALRALVSAREEAVVAIEQLLAAVAEAYSHVRSAASEQGDPAQVENLIRSELRKVSEAVQAD